MEFTYQAYRGLLSLLRKHGYAFQSYYDYEDISRCVILRHDVDASLTHAVKLAEIDAGEGARSTWFVLLRTDLYNVASKDSLEKLRRIQSLGHEIGLHFDETAYPPALKPDEVVEDIIKECGILSALLETPVSCVSMHRPSQTTLGADYHIPGIVNSYGKTFFHDFKYLSDSRRRWREPVEEVIRSERYDRLHILTHAFAYCEEAKDFSQLLKEFVCSANRERYWQLAENITDINSVLKEEDVL